jgi:hypothetical protein
MQKIAVQIERRHPVISVVMATHNGARFLPQQRGLEA